jgi:hypothetical protein
VSALADDHEHAAASELAFAGEKGSQRAARRRHVVPVQVERRARRASQVSPSAGGAAATVTLDPAVAVLDLEAWGGLGAGSGLAALRWHHAGLAGRERHGASAQHHLDEAGFGSPRLRHGPLFQGAQGLLLERASSHGEKVADVRRGFAAHGRKGFS